MTGTALMARLSLTATLWSVSTTEDDLVGIMEAVEDIPAPGQDWACHRPPVGRRAARSPWLIAGSNRAGPCTSLPASYRTLSEPIHFVPAPRSRSFRAGAGASLRVMWLLGFQRGVMVGRRFQSGRPV